jgi:integrase
MNNYILATDEPVILRKGSRRVVFYQGLGHMKLSSVTRQTIGRFRDNLRAAGTSIYLTRAILRVAHAMFEHGIELDYIRSNPARGVRVIGHRDEGSGKVVPPMPDFVAELLAEPSSHRPLLALLATTGLRISEALALRWRHIDFDDKKLAVRTRVDGRYREEGHGTKSTAGTRDVPISSSTLALLMEHRKASMFGSDDDLVFVNGKGTYLSQGNLRRRFLQPLFDSANARLPPKAQYGGQAGFHVFRHFAISSWINQGLPMKMIQTYAGHSSIKVTMDRYGHLFPSEDQHEAIDRIAASLGL